MSKELYSIGEVSKMKGVTIKALRFYEKIGLLKPFEVNTYNQYRYYHVSQFVYIDIIKAARALEISPNALIPYFREKDTQGIIRLLSESKQAALDKIERLNETIEAIDHFSTSFDFAKACDCHGAIQERALPERHVFVMPFELGKETGDYLIDYSKLDTEVNRHGLQNLYDEGVLYAMNASGEFAPAYIFTTISQPTVSEHYRAIPGGRYLSICYNEETAQEQYEKMLQYLVANELAPTHILQVELTANIFEPLSALFEFQVRMTD